MKQNPDNLVVALRASNPQEAEIVRALLEEQGLYVLVPDKNTPLPIDLSPLDGEYSTMGCDVLVRPAELRKAKRIIDEARESGDIEEEEAEADFEDDDEEDSADFDDDE